MKHVFLYLIILTTLLNCSSSNTIELNNIEGYKGVKLAKIPNKITDNTSNINELRFYRIDTTMQLHGLFYKYYGMWNDVQYQKGNSKYLIWNNLQLLEKENERFKVYVSENRKTYKMYSSISILNSKNEDCLATGSKNQQDLIKLFAELMKSKENNELFISIYKTSFTNR